jgi:hypothetical protein
MLLIEKYGIWGCFYWFKNWSDASVAENVGK